MKTTGYPRLRLLVGWNLSSKAILTLETTDTSCVVQIFTFLCATARNTNN